MLYKSFSDSFDLRVPKHKEGMKIKHQSLPYFHTTISNKPPAVLLSTPEEDSYQYAIVSSDISASKDLSWRSSNHDTMYQYIERKPKKCLRPSASAGVSKSKNFSSM